MSTPVAQIDSSGASAVVVKMPEEPVGFMDLISDLIDSSGSQTTARLDPSSPPGQPISPGTQPQPAIQIRRTTREELSIATLKIGSKTPPTQTGKQRRPTLNTPPEVDPSPQNQLGLLPLRVGGQVSIPWRSQVAQVATSVPPQLAQELPDVVPFRKTSAGEAVRLTLPDARPISDSIALASPIIPTSNLGAMQNTPTSAHSADQSDTTRTAEDVAIPYRRLMTETQSHKPLAFGVNLSDSNHSTDTSSEDAGSTSEDSSSNECTNSTATHADPPSSEAVATSVKPPADTGASQVPLRKTEVNRSSTSDNASGTSPKTHDAASTIQMTAESLSKIDATPLKPQANSGTRESVLTELALKTETIAPLRPPPAREITLRLGTTEAGSVDVKVTEHAGKIQLAVRTTDEALAHTLQSNLGDLITRLDRKGYTAQTWMTDPDTDVRLAASALLSNQQQSGDLSRQHSNAGSGKRSHHADRFSRKQKSEPNVAFSIDLGGNE